MLSSITQSPKKPNGFGFKIYDSKKEKELSYILRRDHESLQAFIKEIKAHPTDPETLVFLLNEIDNFHIIEMHMIGVNSLEDIAEVEK